MIDGYDGDELLPGEPLYCGFCECQIVLDSEGFARDFATTDIHICVAAPKGSEFGLVP